MVRTREYNIKGNDRSWKINHIKIAFLMHLINRTDRMRPLSKQVYI
jgi:hypothetical protein